MSCDLCGVCGIKRLPYGNHHIKSIEGIFGALLLCKAYLVCHPKALIKWFPNIKSILPNPFVLLQFFELKGCIIVEYNHDHFATLSSLVQSVLEALLPFQCLFIHERSLHCFQHYLPQLCLLCSFGYIRMQMMLTPGVYISPMPIQGRHQHFACSWRGLGVFAG